MKNLISCLLCLIVFNGLDAFSQSTEMESESIQIEQQISNSYDILESYQFLNEESDTLSEKVDSLYLIWERKIHNLQKSKEVTPE